MNRIYSVIWSYSHGCYVVASELASRKKIIGKSVLKFILVGIMAFIFPIVSLSQAATGISGGRGSGISISPNKSSNCAEANTDNLQNIAIGCDSYAEGEGTRLYDRNNPENIIDLTGRYNSIAIGSKSSAHQGSVALGHGAISKELGVAFGSQAKSTNVAAIAIGPAALATGNTSLALGRQSAATGDFSQALGNVSIAKGKGSLAVGHSATATGDRSIAIGSADIDNAGSTGNQQGVMYQKNQQTLSTGKDSIAIGAAAKAEGDYTLAAGAHAKAEGANSTAMGYDSSATGMDAFSAGRSAKAEGQDAFALGAQAHGRGIKSFAMGTGSQAIGENALALGSLSVAQKINSIAVGVGAQANFADSVALGSGAIVSHDNSISIGTGSTTNDYDATAFLFKEGVVGAVATGAVSIGNGAGAIQEGSKSNERRLQNLAAGSLDTDAVNVSQLKNFKAITDKSAKDVADHLGGDSKYNPETGEVTKPTYNITNKDGDMIVHNNVGGALDVINNTIQNNTTNITNLDSRVTVNEGAITSITDGKSGLVQVENGQIVFDNEIDGADGAVFNIANKDGSVRKIDGVAEATLNDQSNEAVSGKQLHKTNTNVENLDGRVTINEGDITNITSGKSGLVQLSDEGEIVIDNTLADNATFNLANADGTARQLTGVKDGELSTTSTDAVNGSQLHATNTNVENLDGRVTINEGNISTIQGDITNITNKTGQSLTGIEEALGGGAKFDENGKLYMPNYKDALAADDDLNSVEEGFKYVNGKLTGITTGTAGLIKLSDDGKSLVVDNSLAKDATVFDFSNNGIDRTLTGVAKGKLDNDAVNVSQLKKVTDGLGGGSEVDKDGNVTGPTYNITNKEGDNVVHNNVGDALTEIDQSVTNITNKTGQSLTGIEEALGGGAKFDENGKLDMPNYKDALTADKDLKSVEAGFEYVGDKLIEHGDQITNIEGDVTNLDNRVTVNEGDIKNITEGKSGLVQVKNGQIVFDNEVDGANGAAFNIANRDGSVRKIDGVAEAALHDNSNEAVSGKQLNATNESIAKSLGGEATYSGGNLANLNFKKALKADADITTVYDGFEYLKDNLQSFEDGEAGLLQLKDGKLVFSEKTLGATFDITDGKDARTLTGVKAGAVAETSLDAINGSQLYATNKSIVDSLGGGAELNEDGSIKGPTYVINNGDSYDNVGDAITNIDGRVISNTKNITNLTENMNNITTGKAGLVMIEGDRIVFDNSIAGDRIFDISNNGQARKMAGVADGNITAGSKDAVNGGQLYGTNEKVSTNTNTIGKNTDALGGGAGIDKDGNYTGPNYSFTDGSNHTNVGSALDNLDGRVTDLDNRVDGITNGTEGLVKLETDDQGNQKLVIDNDLASKAGKFDISNGEDGRTLTGVNKGEIAEGSKDAVNGSQLHASNNSIANIFGGGATIDKDGYVSMPEYDFGDENKFNNVGDSLAHLNNKIQKGGSGLFQMSADGQTVILSDTAKDATTVNMGDRVIAGVANGKVEQGSMEAVNGGQLWETNQQVSTNTNQIKHINNTLNHYNMRINNLEKTVHENRKRASAGTASAMAMSSIPYLDYAKYSFGMGVASYDGEAAMSLGLEFKMGGNGRFRIQGSYDTQSKAGVGVGMAFEL